MFSETEVSVQVIVACVAAAASTGIRLADFKRW